MGKNVDRLLKFAVRFPTWHSFGKDRGTNDAIRTLANKGLVVVNDKRQWRLALTGHYAGCIDCSEIAPKHGDIIQFKDTFGTVHGESALMYQNDVLVRGLFRVIVEETNECIVVSRHPNIHNDKQNGWVFLRLA